MRHRQLVGSVHCCWRCFRLALYYLLTVLSLRVAVNVMAVVAGVQSG